MGDEGAEHVVVGEVVGQSLESPDVRDLIPATADGGAKGVPLALEPGRDEGDRGEPFV
jgi:hypothetical protein